jgi:hypothetical protein
MNKRLCPVVGTIKKLFILIARHNPTSKDGLLGSHTVYNNMLIPTFRRTVLLSIHLNQIQWSWRRKHHLPPKLRNKHYPNRCKHPKDYHRSRAHVKSWELKPHLLRNFELLIAWSATQSSISTLSCFYTRTPYNKKVITHTVDYYHSLSRMQNTAWK